MRNVRSEIGSRCRACWGVGVLGGLRGTACLHRPAHPHPESSLARHALRFALPALRAGLRRSGSRCRLLSWGGTPAPLLYTTGYEWRGAEKSAMWVGVDVASANLQDSSHRRLARAPRRGLPGPRPQVLLTRFASRAVRWRPASRFFPRPAMKAPRPSHPRVAFRRAPVLSEPF